MREIDVAELNRLLSEPESAPPLVDVREPGEFDAGHVPGAVNIPMSQALERVEELTTLAARPGGVLLVCRSGNRSGQVGQWLSQQGHEATNVEGGTLAWQHAGYPTE